MSLSKEKIISLYTIMQKIRSFENRVVKVFAEGKIPGFAHLYIGEEAIASGACFGLRNSDYITSTHRGHGHIIAKGGDIKFMMAELFGKETGYCKGKGGSMHIADASIGILGANGIVGAGQNIAVGAGLSLKYKKTDNVCVCFFGDGSTNQGTFHEALNMASIWKLPVIFVAENNFYGISMNQRRHQAVKDISDRASSYNIPGISVDGNDVFAVYESVTEAIDRARKGYGPTLIECKTYRQRGHFEGDPAIYKPKEEQEEWIQKDPIIRMQNYLLENEILSEKELNDIVVKLENEMDEAVKFAVDSPYPKVESIVEDIYTDIVEEVRK